MKRISETLRKVLDGFPSAHGSVISLQDANFLISTLLANDTRRCLVLGPNDSTPELLGQMIDAIDADIELTAVQPENTRKALDRMKDRFDLVYVHGDGRHPWPLIKTLFAMPILRVGGVITIQDLLHYRKDGWREHNGPHLLYQGVQAEKWRSNQPGASIGSIRLIGPPQKYTSDLLKIAQQPWTITDPMPSRLLKDVLRSCAHPMFAESFAERLRKVFVRQNRITLRRTAA